MKRSGRCLTIATISAALLVFIASGCGQIPGLGGAAAPRATGGTSARAVTIAVQPVKEGPISLVLGYAGNVQSVDQINVVPKVGGRIERMLVDAGSTVKAGDLLASLERASLDPSVKQAEANLAVAQARLATVQAGSRAEDIASAEAALVSARARLAQVKNGPTSADLQAALGSVASAQSALTKAQTDLQKLRASPTDDDQRGAQLDLDKARNSLYSAQMARDSACGNNRESSQCRTQDGNVFAAQTALEQAQRSYDKVKAGPKAEDVAVAEQAVASAQAQLTSAQAKLAQLKSQPMPEDVAIASAAVTQAESQLSLKKTPYTERDIQTAQAQVAQAQAGLDAARLQLGETNVVAPFDGVITQKLLDVGSIAASQSPLFVLATSAVEVAVSVEESRLGLVEVGQSVALSVPAYPGLAIPAKVSTVAPVADAKTHTFGVKVAPETQDGKLRAGMFADVKITAQQNPRAVLAPKTAIVERGGKSVIFVAADNKAAARELKIGLSDDRQVEVVSGLTVGEMIVVSGQASLNDGDAVRLAGQLPAQAPAKTGGQPDGTPGAGGRSAGAGAKPAAGATPGTRGGSAADATPASKQ